MDAFEFSICQSNVFDIVGWGLQETFGCIKGANPTGSGPQSFFIVNLLKILPEYA